MVHVTRPLDVQALVTANSATHRQLRFAVVFQLSQILFHRRYQSSEEFLDGVRIVVLFQVRLEVLLQRYQLRKQSKSSVWSVLLSTQANTHCVNTGCNVSICMGLV